MALGALALILGMVIPTHWSFKVATTAFYTVLVLASAALGGFGPGVLSTLLCAAAVAYWVEPPGHFYVEEPAEAFGVALFVASGLIVSGICERMHRAMLVERAARGLAERTARAEREAHEATRRAERAREEMLSLVAHDLRDPLGVIDMNAGLIDRAASANEEVRRRTALQHRTVRRMSRLVRNVLDSSMLEAGELSLDLAVESVEPLFEEAVEEHEPEARAKAVRLEYELACNLPLVRCDHDRIIQVLSNLLGNALRFTPSGGRVWLTADLVDGAVRLCVRDSGAGISPELLPLIFERYSRERRDRGGRTGLGLSIAKAIVERHGGTIQVESEEGVGSTFSFTLPITAPRPTELRPPSSEAHAAPLDTSVRS
ncbi:Phytochrome, two-component sensor histidine kinase [Minicystis rosea]|nr:Phytochrome, two-component sensor histidine kinase [Minicystis rosea]